MGLFDWLTKRQKSLSEMTRSELRRQELLLEKERERLMGRVSDLAKKKQDIFERGSKEKTPELRRALAQEFELRTTEQLVCARQLNIKSKETLTVGRLRMLKENAERAASVGSKLGLVGEKDILALEKLIENDAITSEMYQDRLDAMLQISPEAGEAASLSAAGQQVLNVWQQMDRGILADPGEAFDEADRRVREQQKAAAEGMA